MGLELVGLLLEALGCFLLLVLCGLGLVDFKEFVNHVLLELPRHCIVYVCIELLSCMLVKLAVAEDLAAVCGGQYLHVLFETLFFVFSMGC